MSPKTVLSTSLGNLDVSNIEQYFDLHCCERPLLFLSVYPSHDLGPLSFPLYLNVVLTSHISYYKRFWQHLFPISGM